jgi:neutral amino acid transport system permease protein
VELRGQRRTAIALLILLDACFGLLWQWGLLNGLDTALGGRLPNDLVWLLQSLESLCAGFFFVKILFDDVPEGYARSIGIASSPLFLLLVVWLTLDMLLKGFDSGGVINLDLASIATGTLIWSSTYLAIAVGLTLTYKVQRYGNFAQSELFMIGMYLSMVMVWSDHFLPLYDAPRDGVIVWSLLFWTVLAAFVLTGLAGIILDRLVYRGFREKNASPQVMMIASLGVALVLRAIVYLRFGASRNMFEPDADWRVPTLRWDLPTQKLKLNLGNRDLSPAESLVDANGNGVWDSEELFTDLDGDGLWDAAQTYTGYECNPDTMERIVHEGSKPALELYNLNISDCVNEYTTGYAYYKGAVPIVIFSSVLLLILLLRKTRLGRRMRAVADNPDLAASSGINVERVQMTSAFLSAGISGMGGAIFAMTLRFSPETAFTLLLPSFAVIVLGTIGSIPGAVVAALLVGFVRALSSPVLIGIGMPLGRSNYTALDGVMPYVFLIAILLIMPEGIGAAYEKWQVNRLRKRAESEQKPSYKVGGLLALSPLGALGIHNFQQRKNARGETMLIATVGAYVISRLTRFIGGNSFAEGACSGACQDPLDGLRNDLDGLLDIADPTTTELSQIDALQQQISEFSDTNFEIVTGRSEGEFILEDSPFTLSDAPNPPDDLDATLHEQWFTDALNEMSNSWLDMMNTELALVDNLASLGDALWPAVPILVWIIAAIQGYHLLKRRDEDALRPLTEFLDNLSAPVTQSRNSGSVALTQALGTAMAPLDSFHTALHDSMDKFRSGFDNNQRNLFLFFLIVTLAAALPPFFGRAFAILALLWGVGLTILSSRSGRAPLMELSRLSPYGRESPVGSWVMFLSVIVFLLLFVEWLPVAEQDNMRFIKALQVSNVLLTVSIFALMAFSLNLHTGITGMVNFGVIFFVGVGAITVGILTAPKDLHGYDWPIFWAVVVGVLLSAAFGWLLAYPTARLRMDYFAIVTISLGEITRVILMGEPLLRVGSWGSSIGISRYPLPLQKWWFCGSGEHLSEAGEILSKDQCDDVIGIGSPAEKLGRSDIPVLDQSGEVINGEFLYEATWYSMDLGQPAPYMMMLAIMGVIAVFVIWWLLETILKSPWGRILRAIREDEEVAQHHGHDVLTHKAASLALGAAIAALAGSLWAWKLTGFQPSFMAPAKSTFLVWAAFVVGGTANNRGMIVGAFVIVLMEFVFNVLVAGQGSTDLPLHETAANIDRLFEWLVTKPLSVVKIFLVISALGMLANRSGIFELGLSGVLVFLFVDLMMGARSIEEAFVSNIETDMAYVKVFLIGCLILFSLKYNPKGILPEVPNRPHRPTILGGDGE